MGSTLSILRERVAKTGESCVMLPSFAPPMFSIRGRLFIVFSFALTGYVVYGGRLFTGLCAGVCAASVLHFVLPRPDFDKEMEALLPSYMRTHEFKSAIKAVGKIYEKLGREADLDDAFHRWLPVNIALLWTYHTERESSSRNGTKMAEDSKDNDLAITVRSTKRNVAIASVEEEETMPEGKKEKADHQKEPRVPLEAHRVCLFATSAYGTVIAAAVGLLSPQAGKEALGSLIKDGEESSLIALICARTGLKDHEVLFVRPEHKGGGKMPSEGATVTPGQLCPMHFLAIDHKLKAVILSIRGTASISDVLTDLLCSPRRILGGIAHDGFLRSAYDVLAYTRNHIEKALTEHEGYRLIVTGHSLGAGVALMISMLLRKAQRKDTGIGHAHSFPGVPSIPESSEIFTYAFAPPPIFSPPSPVWDSSPEGSHLVKNTMSFVMEFDAVPRLSYPSVLDTLRKISQIGETLKRDFSLLDRVHAIARPESTIGVKVLKAIHESIAASDNKYSKSTRRRRNSVAVLKRGLPVMEIPGTILMLKESTPGGQGVAMEEHGTNTLGVRKVAAAELSEVVITSRLFRDHLPLPYETAIKTVLCRQKESVNVS